MNSSNNEDFASDLAIIGMSGRFPKSNSIDEFWQNLREGRDCISWFSDEELRESGVEPDLIANRNYVRAKGILESADLFDAGLFGFNPREAATIDPQQRQFLECSWEAMESAGYNPEKYDGLIGVYAGARFSSYLVGNILPGLSADASDLEYYQAITGNDKDHLVTRVSYKLNLRGPSVAVQTACSTSLVSVAMACHSLLSYQCDIALAGGVSVILPQKTGYLYTQGMIFSPDGRCRAFDANAQGTVVGEGVAIVVLKRLADALHDGDHIHAVIKGAAVNNDGSLKVGYTAPSVEGQAEVIAMAQAMAGVSADTISYVEAHGTGTPLGDPVEIAALTKAFTASTDKKQFCAIGSVKTNIGHLDAAAGAAGLIKVVLALENKELPPSLHFNEPNPKIDFENSPFYVNRQLVAWTPTETPRRAGVSSFGMGGTNAHVIVEEAPPAVAGSASRPWQLLVLSAHTESALGRLTAGLQTALGRPPSINLPDVAFTLQVGRRRLKERRTVVCRDAADAVQELSRVGAGMLPTGSATAENPQIVFMFSGQGSQYVNMALELYQSEPTFRESVDYCAAVLEADLGLDLRNVIYPREAMTAEAAQRLTQTSLTQPALFVTEYALAKLLGEWGVNPAAMIGHSLGEYVAACIAGVLPLESALQLVALRGRLMQEQPSGSMLAVSASEQIVVPLLGDMISVAAVNSPETCVVAGPNDAVRALAEELAAREIDATLLHTSHAFHSRMMEPMIPAFKASLERVNLRPPRMRYVSNVTGTWITDAEATDPSYWVRHLRQTVRFSAGLTALLELQHPVLLEVGPGQALLTSARRHPARARDAVILSTLRHPKEAVSDLRHLLNTVGQLWISGVDIDWPGFYKRERRHRVPLPVYPFDRKRCWLEPIQAVASRPSETAAVTRTPDIADWFYAPSWKRSIVPGSSAPSHLNATNTQVIAFVDDLGVGQRVVSRLKRDGFPVTSVKVGTEFRKTGIDTFSINPNNGDNYASLFRDVGAREDRLIKCIHLWGISDDLSSLPRDMRLAKTQDYGFFSLLLIAQAIGRLSRSRSIHLELVTNQLYEVTGGELLCPEKATVTGPFRVIPQEYPNVTCRSIDVDLSGSLSGNAEELAEQLVHEVLQEPRGEIIAYRGGYRWIQTLEPVHLDNCREERQILKDGGVYLITGGTGGIGLTLAEAIAEKVRAKIVLISRRALPEPAEWEADIDTIDKIDPLDESLQKIDRIKNSGSEVCVLKADVGNEQEMVEAIGAVHRKFGEINGVVHAAGVAGGGVAQMKSREQVARVFLPKVQGTLIVSNLLSDDRLDFFILCSSLSSVVGGAGQIDYCAANAFLDAFAQANRRGNTISVDWYAWNSVGMAINTPVPESQRKERERILNLAISPEEGKQIFYRAMASPLSQIVVSTEAMVKGSAVEKPGARFGRDGARVKGEIKFSEVADTPKPSLGTYRGTKAVDAPRNRLERMIADVWQEILGVETVGISDDYFELGGDSLTAIRLMSKLVETLKVDMPLHSLLDARTVDRFAKMVTEAEGGEKWLTAPEAEAPDAPSSSEMRSSGDALTPTERRVLEVWMRVLGTEQVSSDSSFIELQGNRNLFAQMVEEVRREFGVFAEGLPTELLAQNPSVDFLARVIDEAAKPADTLVVRLEAGGEKRPLFLIHAAGGYVFFYRALAHRLGQERPIYAVRADTGVGGKSRAFDQSASIVELAERYIAEIKIVQPQGPYLLGGASLGGVIAFEMARQLVARGEQLGGPLLLFSAKIANNVRARELGVAHPGSLRHRFNFLLGKTSSEGVLKAVWYVPYKVLRAAPWEFRDLVTRGRRRLAVNASRVVAALAPLWPNNKEVSFELKQERIMERFVAASDRLLLGYTPDVLHGRIVLIKPAHYEDLEDWWYGLAAEGIAVHAMPGGHLDMLEEPTVKETAALIMAYLAEGE